MSTKVLTVGDKVRVIQPVPIHRGKLIARGDQGEVLQVYQSGNAHVKFPHVDQVVHVLAEEMERV